MNDVSASAVKDGTGAAVKLTGLVTGGKADGDLRGPLIQDDAIGDLMVNNTVVRPRRLA